MKVDNKVRKAELIFNDLTKLICEEKEEIPHLDNFIENEREEIENLISRLRDEQRTEQILTRLKQIDETNDIRRLKMKLKGRRTLRRRRITLFTSLSAAAAILLSFLLFNREVKPTTVIAHHNEVERPTLIVETGERILLDTIQVDIKRDAYAVKHANNNLNYKSNRSDATTQITYNELILPAKCTYNLILADGSEVFMNAGSRIKFPVQFSGNSREIELSGEAYFKVVKSEIPFIVKSNQLSIRVYGTEFNLNLSDIRADAVLVEGCIGATIEGREEIIMQPNQQLSYNIKNEDCKLSEVDTYLYTQWMEGSFKYVDKPLMEVLDDLAKWYGIDFVINEEIPTIEVTLFSSRDVDVKEVLDLIEVVTKVKFIREGGTSYSISIK